MSKEKKSGINDLMSSMMPMMASSVIMTGLMGSMLGGNKMFGEQEKIPKGVVKEMTHGLMLGVQDMIAEKDYEIRDLKESLERKENDLKEAQNDAQAIQRRYDEVMQFAHDMKAKEAEAKKASKKKPGPAPGFKVKKPYTGKKRGPKPKAKKPYTGKKRGPKPKKK